MGWLVASALTLVLAACGGGGNPQRPVTPAGVAEATTIDFANIANYSAPKLPAYFDRTVTALDNSPTSSALNDRVATLGRVLFYDLRLSTNDRASCASCHRQADAFTDRRAHALGSTGQAHPRSAMSLTNVAYNASYGWADPGTRTLEAQMSVPMLNERPIEMGLKGNEAAAVDAFAEAVSARYAQYLGTRAAYYRLEQRWSGAQFWKSRQREGANSHERTEASWTASRSLAKASFSMPCV